MPNLRLIARTRNFPEKSTPEEAGQHGQCSDARMYGVRDGKIQRIKQAERVRGRCSRQRLAAACVPPSRCRRHRSPPAIVFCRSLGAALPRGNIGFTASDRENGNAVAGIWRKSGSRAHRAAHVRHAEASHAAPAARSSGERVTSSAPQAASKASPDDTAWKSVDAAVPSEPSGRGQTTGQSATASPLPAQRSNPFVGWPDPAAGSAASSAAAAAPPAADAPAGLTAPATSTAPAPAASAIATAPAALAMNNPVAQQDQSVARPVTAADGVPPVATAKAAPAQAAPPVSMLSLVIGFAGALLASALAAHLILKLAAAWRRRIYLENRARQTMRPVREPFRGNEPNLMAAQIRNRPEAAPRRDIARGLFPNASEQRARPDALRELLAPLDRDSRPRR